MLHAACGDEIDGAIILALGRLGRKTKLVLDLVERLDKCQVEIVSVKEMLDTSTPQGRFVLTMFAAVVQLELDMIAQRTTDGRNVRGQQDGEKGGRVPMGYQRLFNGGSGSAVGVTVDQDEAKVVRTIFTRRAAGESMRSIADILSSTSVVTSRGHQWHASSVKAILDNEEKYLGGKRGKSEARWPIILR